MKASMDLVCADIHM